MRAADPAICLLVRPQRLGLASAYLAGFAHAVQHGYDLAFEMEGNLSRSPRCLPLFLKQIGEPDLLVGSRYASGGGITNWNPIRRLISRSGNLYARTALSSGLQDFMRGFKCFRVSALRRFDRSTLPCDRYGFQIELSYLVARNGFRAVEIPIVFEERRAGRSKMSWRIVLEALTRVWAHDSLRPRRPGTPQPTKPGR